jgi:DNA repair exonuclease SbcCD ATPase subunit
MEKKDGIEMEAAKEKEAVGAETTEIEAERSSSAAEPFHWLMKNIRRHKTYLGAAVCMILFSLIITSVWVAPIVNGQNEKIASIEAGLEHQMMASDGRLYEQFKWYEANTTADMNELRSIVKNMKEHIETIENELQHEKAKNIELKRKINENSDKIAEWERQNAEMEETVREIHENTTSVLQSKIETLEEELTSTTASTMTIELELRSIARSIVFLNTTKASTETVNDQIGLLDRDKVDRSEFEVLSSNLSFLAETSSTEHEEIRQELNELADSALNETHYHELHQAIASKASHFDGRIQTLNATLSTKADKQDVTTLSNRVTTLEGSTVDKNTFQVLKGTVEDIDERTADKTDLNLLQGRVNSLERNTATKSELRSLDDKLSGHSSTSDGVHNRLSSSIGSNSYSISGNTGRITQLESSTSGLTPSQVVIAVSLSLTLVRWASY